MRIHQYVVYGRRTPTEQEPNPEVVCFRVFAKNENFARSQFWKLNKALHKFKASAGEILRVQQITERNPLTVRNYGIYFRYRNRTSQVNAFKEFRAPNLQDAVSQLYTEMGSKQKVTKESISIIRVVRLRWEDLIVRNQRALRYKNSADLEVGHWRRRFRPAEKRFRTHFNARRPTVFKTGKNVTK